MSDSPETIELDNGFVVAKFEGGNVAIKTPDGLYFSNTELGFEDTTLEEYYDQCFEHPLYSMVQLAYACQYHASLLNRLRVIALKYFTSRILTPVMHIHHNKLQGKFTHWNPLQSWDDPATQFSRVCLDPQSFKNYGTLLKFSQQAEGNGIVLAKYKKDILTIKGMLEEGIPLSFGNAYDNLTFMDYSEPVKSKVFLPKVVPPAESEESVPFRFIAEFNDENAPWAQPFLYSCAAYVYSRFCRNPTLERQAFKDIVGEQYEHYMQAVHDHHHVPKDRFKKYHEGNKFTKINEPSYDFVYPTLAKTPKQFSLTVELDQFDPPAKREEKAAKKAERERLKAKKS